jgi:hypothetical protein
MNVDNKNMNEVIVRSSIRKIHEKLTESFHLFVDTETDCINDSSP